MRAAAVSLWWGLIAPSVAMGHPLSYVEASSQLQGKVSPQKYHPLLLTDDDATTGWCEGSNGSGEGEWIRFVFKKPQRIDRVVLGPAAFAGRMVDSVRISDGSRSFSIPLGNNFFDQPLKQTMRGTTFTVTIEALAGVGNSKLGNDVACLAEMVLYFKGRPFGAAMDKRLLSFNKRREKILGKWSGEPLGAPERFLTFSLDGTWRWEFIPLLGGRQEKRTGEYRFRGNRLLMRKGETGRWADMGIKWKLVRTNPDDLGAPKDDYYQFTINSMLGKQIAGEYNNAQFQ